MSNKPIEIRRPDGAALPENHHLDYRADKGDFRMKVTVDVDGGRFVGKRILIPLHTHDINIARQVRDGIIAALSKAGVLSRPVELIEESSAARGDNSSNCNMISESGMLTPARRHQ